MPNIVYTVPERVEMVRQREQGFSYRCIVDHFAATHPDRPIPSQSSVQKIVQQFHHTGNLDPSLTKVSYPHKQLPEETKLKICLAVQEHPDKPLSKIAEELHISKSSVHKVIRMHNQRPRKYKKRRKSSPPTKVDENRMVLSESSPSSSFSSSPLHFSLWSYVKDKLNSEGRAEDLANVWDKVNNVLESLDQQIISKINSALDTTPERKEEVLNLSCKTENS